MTFLNIILGLLGLGIVVFFHELGHFLAARLVGINVEAFSIGWGMPILKKKVGLTEYRLGLFPLGGYCKMQGDSDYNNEAYVNLENGIVPEKGSYLAAKPAARILVCIGGPLFNLLFAIVLLSFLWGIGFEINTRGNKIVLASEVDSSQVNPADIAGLKTGDRIVEIEGKKITYFHELQESIALNPNKQLGLLVERGGRIYSMNVTPSLDKSTGAGKIGIFSWADPVIGTILDESPAFHAGIKPGDVIKSVNGHTITNNVDFMKAMLEEPQEVIIDFYRSGSQMQTNILIDEDFKDFGFSWEAIRYRTPNLSVPAAIAKGIKESYRTLKVTVTSLRLLFMGIDLTQAVSGPIRITYMMGDTATQGFSQGFGIGIRSITNFIALISIALCVMNMLPLPILDGGMVILFLVEIIRGKPLPPKVVAVFQTCGIVIIIGLMLFALFGDILFFARQFGPEVIP